ncbi:MAG: dethiobiotin synthase [Planctomycetes bacterium]|nr:dethiobiotin synthase [Planctomycetota bacterium]
MVPYSAWSGNHDALPPSSFPLPHPMIRKPRRGLFITGTDTGVGKTHIGELIAKRLVGEGRRVGVYKPVQSGGGPDGAALDDASRLWHAAGCPLRLGDVCPQAFDAPLAPQLAARREGREVDPDLLRDGLRVWADHCDIVLVEGAGGFLSPLDDEDFVADLAVEFAYPLIVVVPNRLGAVNQALLTLVAASTFRDGVDVAGVIVNDPGPEDSLDASALDNPREIARRSVPPVLERVRFGQQTLEGDSDYWELASLHPHSDGRNARSRFDLGIVERNGAVEKNEQGLEP